MIRQTKYILALFVSALFIFNNCKNEKYSLGEFTTPTNVEIAYEITGADSENLYGDGSGLVTFTGSADNSITYNYNFGDGSNKSIAPYGTVTHQFSQTDTNVYNVTFYAVGTGGLTSSKTIAVVVYSSFTDEEAAAFLTGGESKKWYWAADQPGHAGMGTQGDDYGNLDYTFASWWSASPFEKTCMYDAEFVFTKTSDGLSFEQTAGYAYIPGGYAGKIGVEGDACHGEDVVSTVGVKTVRFSPSTSKASIDGEYRGTTMSFSDNGFMCWWVGSSEYDIIELTENILKVRIKEDETTVWYHTFVPVKPVE